LASVGWTSKTRIRDGTEAEVLAKMQDWKWIRSGTWIATTILYSPGRGILHTGLGGCSSLQARKRHEAECAKKRRVLNYQHMPNSLGVVEPKKDRTLL
jgi:hypothetical protein